MAAAAPAAAPSEEEIAKMEASINEQGAKVRTLKKDKATPKDVLADAVAELKRRKKLLEDSLPKPWDRAPFEDLLKRRFVYAPAFEIYGGCAGFYDYGPVGCAIKANFVNAWREHFVLTDSMLEVDTPAMTPEAVLKASGHVERFTDVMVKDLKNGECIRADHLLEDVMEGRMADKKLSADEKEEARLIHAQADAYSKAELQDIFAKFGIKSPAGNELSPPEDFNMMFSSQIGPSGHLKGFLRPETAQGIFLAFRRLYDYNNKKLPFAGAQIGMAYRNEISPRNGMLRVREFQMAEIEHFLDPEDKSCPKFASVAHLEIPMLTADDQVSGKPIKTRKLGDAVADGTVNNETLGYFVGRIFEFLMAIGADVTRLRFRQHMRNEMAHYACDCWDAELQTSFGWVECVGCADRSAYDLSAHAKASGQTIEAAVALKEPIEEDKVEAVPNKKKMGPKYRKAAGAVMKHLANLSNDEALAIEACLNDGGDGVAKISIDGAEYELDSTVVSIEKKTVKTYERKFVPSVIEPSFGIGRCIFCVLEHVYAVRDKDEQRGYLRLPPLMAPVKCSLLPKMNTPEIATKISALKLQLTKLAISAKVDDSGASLGKRYARTDEIGIPFGITVDEVEDGQATIRERDSTEQIRAPLEDIPQIIFQLANALTTFQEYLDKYGRFEPPSKDE